MTGLINEARDVLLAARRGSVGALPDLGLDDAYRVQAAVLARRGAAVGGWKVAVVGGRAAAAPIADIDVFPSHAALVHAVGTRIESEIGFMLGRDLPPRTTPYSRVDILDAIAGASVAFEIVCARRGEPPAVPFTAFLADGLGNAGVVVGATLDGRAALPHRAVLSADGVEIAAGEHPLSDPLAALLAWVNDQQDVCGGLRAGQRVITGSFTGAPLVTAGPRYVATFGDPESSVTTWFLATSP
jgi:2-keto-4-pentenoate hydratase